LLSDDDRRLIPLLEERGIEARAAVWSDASVDWRSADGVLIRSCWDYHLRHDEFLAWVDRLERAEVRMWNSPSLLRWNTDKRYLRDLEAKGIAIVPTHWGDRSSHLPLAEQLAALSWEKAVIKPCVSASSYKTTLVTTGSAGGLQAEYDELVLG